MAVVTPRAHHGTRASGVPPEEFEESGEHSNLVSPINWAVETEQPDSDDFGRQRRHQQRNQRRNQQRSQRRSRVRQRGQGVQEHVLREDNYPTVTPPPASRIDRREAKTCSAFERRRSQMHNRLAPLYAQQAVNIERARQQEACSDIKWVTIFCG